MRDLQNEKNATTSTSPTYSPLSEVKGVRIIVISFRNIAKKGSPLSVYACTRNKH